MLQKKEVLLPHFVFSSHFQTNSLKSQCTKNEDGKFPLASVVATFILVFISKLNKNEWIMERRFHFFCQGY